MMPPGVRRALPYLIAAAGGFLAAFTIVAFFIFPAGAAVPDLRVPSVVGLPYAQATQQLEDAGLDVARGEQRYNDSVPAGTVVNQTPAPNMIANEGTSVILDVSLGEHQSEVPSLVRLTREQAHIALRNAGLKLGRIAEVADSAPRGQVLSSDPVAHTPLPPASAVNITVSAGPDIISVPDVTGQSYSTARSLLTQLGLVVGRTTVDFTSTLPPNTVISQTPGANNQVTAGSSVDLTVSPGGDSQ